jgi:hypothetical protein
VDFPQAIVIYGFTIYACAPTTPQIPSFLAKTLHNSAQREPLNGWWRSLEKAGLSPYHSLPDGISCQSGTIAMNKGQVLVCFEEVKIKLFRDWEAASLWQAKFGTPEELRHNTAYCDQEAKTVFVGKDFCLIQSDYVPALHVHELCHAIHDA